MLKLHHMNLLNEIQETTLMMNLYQQQQLQQQQQQLQQQQSGGDGGGASDQMTMLIQQQQSSSGAGMDFGMNPRGSLGLGGAGAAAIGGASQNNEQMSMLRHPQPMSNGSAAGSGSASGNDAEIQKELLKGQQQQAELENKLRKLKEDIAKRQKEAETLEASSQGNNKRGNEGGEEQSNKRVKTEGESDE
jgi:hypothetical protein